MPCFNESRGIVCVKPLIIILEHGVPQHALVAIVSAELDRLVAHFALLSKNHAHQKMPIYKNTP